MMEPHSKGVDEDISFRMKIGVILMLLAIVLPSAIISLPISTILVTVVNADERPISNVYVYLGGYSDEYFFIDSLHQGDERSGSFHVRPGTHLIRIIYDCEVAEYTYYPNEVWGSYTLLPFETQDKKFDLQFPL